MFSRHRTGPFAIARKSRLFNRFAARVGGLLLLIGMLAGCTVARIAPLVVADPSDPNVPVRSARYSSVIAGYVSQRPVNPKPWREQNERVTPKGDAQ